ncbi:MAG TPA: pectinesterase family protein [Longimicrobium sp.]|nr:pectinesterase family protein [Longimicrobium sp.]
MTRKPLAVARAPLLGAALLLLAVPSPALAAAPDSAAYAAAVDARHAGAEGARVGGVRTWRTLGGALAAAPAEGGRPYRVLIRNGRYREKLSVTAPDVHLVGESREGTVLTYDAAAGHAAPGGGTWGTRGSYTLRVAAPGFRLERMTVENAFAYMENRRRPDGDPAKMTATQGVAVLTDSASDRAVFRDCVLRGHQDTLFHDGGRAYFAGCAILGSVDFVFGAGQAVFEDCDIVTLDRGEDPNGYVTAPSTPLSRPYGLVFVRSRLRKEHPGMGAGTVALGRPWHPAADPQAVGSAVFVDCWMDDHVSAAGWARMGATPPGGGERVWYEPESARFFEYRSTGPGALSSPSRRVLSDAEAAYFTPAQVLRGWDPREG